MKPRFFVLFLVIIGVVTLIFFAATLIFTPSQTEPAFQAALSFVEAAARGDDVGALTLVSEPIRQYAAANCPEGSISACVDAYTPEEWGDLQRVVFRRATPDGVAWNVELISYYSTDTGASGVCIFTRVEPVQGVDALSWVITRYAGFVHCGDPSWQGDTALRADAPNSAP